MCLIRTLNNKQENTTESRLARPTSGRGILYPSTLYPSMVGSKRVYPRWSYFSSWNNPSILPCFLSKVDADYPVIFIQSDSSPARTYWVCSLYFVHANETGELIPWDPMDAVVGGSDCRTHQLRRGLRLVHPSWNGKRGVQKMCEGKITTASDIPVQIWPNGGIHGWDWRRRFLLGVDCMRLHFLLSRPTCSTYSWWMCLQSFGHKQWLTHCTA